MVDEAYMRGFADLIGMRSGFAFSVPEKFHDLLQGFDLGTNQLIETEMRAFDQVTVRPERYWVFNVVEHKDTLSLEHSDVGYKMEPHTLQKLGSPDHYGPDAPPQRERRYFLRTGFGKKDAQAIVLSAEALDGVDFWRERQVGEGFFVSDRLWKAMKEQGIRGRRMRAVPVRVLL